MKNILSFISFTILWTFLFGVNWYANTINTVEVLNTQTISITLSDEDNFSQWILEWEIKILEDTSVDLVEKDVENARKLLITLPESLEANTSYSLLTLLGAEWSIDFVTPDEISQVQIENTVPSLWEQYITSIILRNPQQIEVEYNSDIIDSHFEFKLLSEIRVINIENTSLQDNRISVNLQDTVKTTRDYIVMILSLFNTQWEEIYFENSIYDFESPEYIEEYIIADDFSPEIEEVEIIEDTSAIQDSIQAKIAARNAAKQEEEMEAVSVEIPEPESIEESQEEDFDDLTNMFEELMTGEWVEGEEINEPVLETEIELNAAPQESSLMKATTDVALTADSTPDTGAETWILILLTLVINTFYHFSRRKIA